MDYKESMKVQHEALNQIDFIPYLKLNKCGINVYDLMVKVEKDYNNSEITNNPVLQGYIFNYLSAEELVDYLYDRYGDKFYAVDFTTTILYINE